MDRCVRFSEDLSLRQVSLQGFDVMWVPTVVLTHVFFNGGSAILFQLTRPPL